MAPPPRTETPESTPAPATETSTSTSNSTAISTEVQYSTAGLPEFTLPAFTIDAVLWERLISSQPKHNLLSSSEGEAEAARNVPPAPSLGSGGSVDVKFHIVTGEPKSQNLQIVPDGMPTGMIQQPALQRFLDNEQPFTGLVVSIGINDSDSSMWHSQGLMQSVGSYIAGLLREKDFSCRTAYDEFVMVCWGEEGPHSQRRLNHISERLWDFQLRGIGACSILFSWGGVQVQDQPLAEAIASATDRMRQTKRSTPPAIAQQQAV
jgi:hypothetical protein